MTFFPEGGFWHFMQIVYLGDNMKGQVFFFFFFFSLEGNSIDWSSAGFAYSVLSVKWKGSLQ